MANKRIYELEQIGINGLTDKLTVKSRFAVDYTTDNGSTFVSKSIEAGDIMVIPMSKPANGTTSFTGLIPGALYGFDSGDQTVSSSNSIFLQAISETKLSTTGYILQWIIKNAAYTGIIEGYLGVLYPGLVVNTGDKVIWGGILYVWNGSNAHTVISSEIISDDGLYEALGPGDQSIGWAKVAITNDNYYEQKLFGIEYDFVLGKVRKQWDDRGNVFTLTTTDANYRQNDSINWLKISDWGNLNIYNNKCGGIFNNRSSSTIEIYNNTNHGLIYRNYNTSDIHSNSNTSDIVNNHNSGSIHSNSNLGNIADNACNSSIYKNSNLGDINNNSITVDFIAFNSNAGAIINNSITEEIQLNSNLGDISNNSNSGAIRGNSNTGIISNNTSATTGNISSIINNSNKGVISNNEFYNTSDIYISNNTNLGNINENYFNNNITTNSNLGNIYNNGNTQNDKVGNIALNSNAGDISGNYGSTTGVINITYNTNNGYINNNFVTFGSGNISISYNTNNGFIDNLSVSTSDTQVNK